MRVFMEPGQHRAEAQVFSQMHSETRETKVATEIAIIEDDEHLREALLFQLSTAGVQCVSYPSAEAFLKESSTTGLDCIIADIFLPRMNGLQLLTEIKRSAPFISIILITGHSDMLTGVQAIREGALDCLEKPIDGRALMRAIFRGTNLSRAKRSEHLRHLELRERESSLTPREREVFALITAGLLNKQIGYKLGPTEWTVKKHRARIMKKMGADSLADLVRMADILHVGAVVKQADR